MSMSVRKSDFEKICRTCLNMKSNMLPLYEDDIIYKLQQSTGVEISENDGLPGNICQECNEQVQKAFCFKNLCSNSQAVLLEVLNFNNLETNSHFLETIPEIQPIIKIEPEESKYEIPDTFITDSVKLEDSLPSESTKLEIDDKNEMKYSREKHNKKSNNKNKLFTKKKRLKKDITCLECGKVFTTPSKLKYHQILHKSTEDRYFPCSICKKICTRPNTLLRHMKIYHGEKPYTKEICNICGKAFTNIAAHMLQKHTKERPHKCLKCDKSYPYRSTLLNHVRLKHEKIEKSYEQQCNICGKCFAASSSLKNHMLCHVEDRLHECQVCHNKYKRSTALKKHMRRHENIRPYKCSYCPKGFFTNLILQNHIRTHTGERPFVCSVCGKAFTQNGALITHMKTHQ